MLVPLRYTLGHQQPLPLENFDHVQEVPGVFGLSRDKTAYLMIESLPKVLVICLRQQGRRQMHLILTLCLKYQLSYV